MTAAERERKRRAKPALISHHSRRKDSIRHQRFVDHYVVSGNAASAAIAAGFSIPGARVQGFRLLANVSIRQQIDLERERLAQLFSITRERIIEELAEIAFSDIADVIELDGRPRLKKGAIERSGRAVASIEIDEKPGRRKLRITMANKTQALALLAQCLGFLGKGKPRILTNWQ